jgi:hypothetical protein
MTSGTPLQRRIEESLRENAGKTGVDKLVAKEVGASPETVRKIRRRLGIAAGKRGRPKKKEAAEPSSAPPNESHRHLARPGDELTRAERMQRLEDRFQTDPKYSHYLESIFDEHERVAFLKQFTDIATDLDTLDSFEEAHLFMAITQLVLSLRYAKRYRQQQEQFDRFLSGDYDPSARNIQSLIREVPPDESLMEEFNKKSGLFNQFREKFARVQEEKRRRVTKGRSSFSDYMEYYGDKSKQSEALREILDMNSATDAELRRMIASKELFGGFDD